MQQERKEAILKLKSSIDVDDTYCVVGQIKVKKADRDLLLKQLEQNEDYLKVPMPLYLGSFYWMNLKNESNKIVQAKKEKINER